ncbi:hypothetical protein [Kitasatospora phosalacinea]|uniref:DUF4241 domain-containing protein n=1 Tax=Kitasatospora phosalacinea TaxID=2065 RepID=A0A9W6ULS5_9ACTN|nr:hypothetical protein [Kitasatospora phosalacinea]GLW52438.1 hypothetical protein Kpho01_04490 [Kitasatospora phosalacinea]
MNATSTAPDPYEQWLLEALFTPGALLGAAHTYGHGPALPARLTAVEEVATVRTPSGRLAVACPWPPDDEPGVPLPVAFELAERVPPGPHRVEAAWYRAPVLFMGEVQDHPEVAAVRLRLTDAPVTRWEAAAFVPTPVGTDPGGVLDADDHGRRHFYDEHQTCAFADAAAWPELVAPFRQFAHNAIAGLPNTGRATESLRDGCFERTSSPARAADLLSFPSSGTTTWLGRAADGTPAAVLVHGALRDVDLAGPPPLG